MFLPEPHSAASRSTNANKKLIFINAQTQFRHTERKFLYSRARDAIASDLYLISFIVLPNCYYYYFDIIRECTHIVLLGPSVIPFTCRCGFSSLRLFKKKKN